MYAKRHYDNEVMCTNENLVTDNGPVPLLTF